MSSRSADACLLDVAEAERAQALLGGRDRERAGTGERVEERREEQLLVDRRGQLPVARWCSRIERVERRLLGSIAETRAPRARCVSAAGSVGQRVGLVLVDELQAVFDGAQPDVRRVERARVRRR